MDFKTTTYLVTQSDTCIWSISRPYDICADGASAPPFRYFVDACSFSRYPSTEKIKLVNGCILRKGALLVFSPCTATTLGHECCSIPFITADQYSAHLVTTTQLGTPHLSLCDQSVRDADFEGDFSLKNISTVVIYKVLAYIIICQPRRLHGRSRGAFCSKW